MNDLEIQRAVLEEFTRDTRIDETEVGVEVDDGIVTLSGTVSSWGKRFLAQELAHRAPDVLDVANDIVVKMPGVGAPTDGEIAGAVREALRDNSRVPDQRIHTTVSDRSVTLEGEVSDALQRYEAERTIRNVPGVDTVTNRLHVASGT